MRLLNVKTRQLEEHFDESIPPYAILSHTWGEDEVLYSHIKDSGYKGGSAKIDGCCAQAVVDGLDYVWIDTCCIDKTSSAELSEAINSMFTWYRDSVICYAYLVDVPYANNHGGDIPSMIPGSGGPGLPSMPSDETHFDDVPRTHSAFAKSRWFTRSWTLQELLAPENVVFFTSSWSPIGRKLPVRGFQRYTAKNLIERELWELPAITGILSECLDVSSGAFDRASLAQKMSWAAGRKSTRREDRAYSLMGLFGVNMPMLYGEGDKAFIRLQEEIMRLTDDQSLLAWGFELPLTAYGSSLLARSPDDFANCGNLFRDVSGPRHYTMTNKGLQIALRLTDLFQGSFSYVARLRCREFDSSTQNILLPLCYDVVQGHFRDPKRGPMTDTSGCFDKHFHFTETHLTDTYISRATRYTSSVETLVSFSLKIGDDKFGKITECYPETWSPAVTQGLVAHIPLTNLQNDTILLIYTGGEVPSFIVKMQMGLSYLREHIECVIARTPEAESEMPLQNLILKGLELSKEEGHAVKRWYNALDDLVSWQTELCPDDGYRLYSRARGGVWETTVNISLEVAKAVKGTGKSTQ